MSFIIGQSVLIFHFNLIIFSNNSNTFFFFFLLRSLHCFMQAFSIWDEQELFIVVASLVVEHGL